MWDVMGIFKGSMPYLAVMIVITLLFIFIPDYPPLSPTLCLPDQAPSSFLPF